VPRPSEQLSRFLGGQPDIRDVLADLEQLSVIRASGQGQ
jgi:hypothetical protein